MISKLFQGDQTVSNGTKTILMLAAATIALVAIASVGGMADTEEMANESGTFDNSSNVTIDVTWNDSITDPANATATATVYNATEYDDDPSTATEIATTTIDADEGNTTETELTEADGLEDGTEYRVIVEADDTEADDVSISFGGGLFAGGVFAGSGGGGLIGVAAIVGLVAIAKDQELI